MTVPPEFATHPFLEGMTPSEVERLADLATPRDFDTGSHLMHLGDLEPGMYLIVDGRVALEVARPGKDGVVVETCQKGEAVGWSWLVNPHKATFDVVALEPTTTYHLDSEGTRALCEVDHDLGFLIARRLLGIVSRRLASTRVRLLDVYADVY